MWDPIRDHFRFLTIRLSSGKISARPSASLPFRGPGRISHITCVYGDRASRIREHRGLNGVAPFIFGATSMILSTNVPAISPSLYARVLSVCSTPSSRVCIEAGEVEAVPGTPPFFCPKECILVTNFHASGLNQYWLIKFQKHLPYETTFVISQLPSHVMQIRLFQLDICCFCRESTISEYGRCDEHEGISRVTSRVGNPCIPRSSVEVQKTWFYALHPVSLSVPADRSPKATGGPRHPREGTGTVRYSRKSNIVKQNPKKIARLTKCIIFERLGFNEKKTNALLFEMFCFPHLTSKGFPYCQVRGIIYFDSPIAEVSSIDTFHHPLFKLFSAVL
jgi:hypothetical protein